MAHHDSARLTTRDLRDFGLKTGGAFLVLGGLMFWREHPIGAWALGGLGAFLVVGGLAGWGLLRPFHKGWFAFSHALSRVTTPILLGILYFGVLTPIGVILRLAGKNPLRHQAGQYGYWHRRAEGQRQRRDMNRQF